MSDLQKLAKGWLNDNMHDGEDRSAAKSDWHKMSAPELYEMVNDLVEHLEEGLTLDLQQVLRIGTGVELDDLGEKMQVRERLEEETDSRYREFLFQAYYFGVWAVPE